MKLDNYEDLIGKFINEVKEDEDYVYFITKDNLTIGIPKFVPYCACNVGEYIDEITKNGTCCGVITNIEPNIEDDDDDFGYEGNVTFYFENGKLDMDVHGEDNGYYGVIFTMPVEII